ncbi:MAG: RagB/SusD family nutrient uptake outer membrane protein [Bacteroides sp.]|nr:RagB/SusD family nutrient uptake outer membrane protein [Bacteroides sp.]
MKKIVYISVCLVVGLLTTACSDYLSESPQSSFSDEVVYSNEKLTENMIFHIYSGFAETNSHRGRFQPFYGMNTDIEIYNDTDLSDPAALCTYSTSTSNAQMSGTSDPNTWTCFYNAIESANVSIRGIQQYGHPTTGNLMGYFYAEALVLRATFYYDLLRAWGDVPARFEPLTDETIYLGKSDRDVIFKQLLADLEEAQDYLPWPNGSERTRTTGRINKAYAKALRARLCLMAAGYAQRPDDLSAAQGSQLRTSNDPELQKSVLYPIAKKELEDIINSNSCKLEGTFEEVFIKNCQDKLEAGGESLFAIPFAEGRGRVMQHFAVYHYDRSKYLDTTNKGGQNVPTPTLYYDYDEDDLRRDVTCVPYKWQGGVQLVRTSNTTKQEGWNWGKYRYEWTAGVRLVTGEDGLNQMYIRYADVLLMLAEVINELGDSEGAKTYLKQVRRRAFPAEVQAAKVDAYLESLTGKEQVFQAIVEERKFELAGEMLRKQDLIRWNMLGEKMAETKQKMTDLRSYQGVYRDVPQVVYYRYLEDEETLEFYGFNRGENGQPSGEGWESVNWQEAVIPELRITRYYLNDPDSRQFWPIFQSDLDNQLGYLVNNYGY